MNSLRPVQETAAASDQTLVARVREGDELAAAELYERYAARVFGLVRSQMADQLRAHVEPEDVVQSIFKSIFRGMNTGGYDAPPAGTLWQLIAVIAVHKVRRNATRRTAAKRDSRRTESLELSDHSVARDRASPEEIEAAIQEAIEDLKPTEQEVVLLRVQGYTVEEIAERTGRSRRTVERQLQRARELLADMLLTDAHDEAGK
jgi:RNA polymerase sigma-70 factor (ECF subfamily)